MYTYFVQSVEQITSSTLLLTLEKSSEESHIFSFQPGQYAAISFMRKGRPSAARCFSVVSSPTDQNILQFSMRTRGRYTSALTKLKKGDQVSVRGPFGGFVFDTERDQNAVFIAGGIGITPFMSMMQFATKLEIKNDITLIYGVASQDDIPFKEMLDEMEAKNPHLKIVYVVGGGPTNKLPHKTVATGFINADILDLYAEHYTEATYFICGPPPLMNGLVKVLQAKNVPKYRLITEAFAQGSHRQTGKVHSWPQNMYILSGVGIAMGSFAVMVADMVNSLPQTNLVKGDGAIDLLSDQTDREKDLDALVNNLPRLKEKKTNSKAVAKALRDARKKSSSNSGSSDPVYYYAPSTSASSSSGGSSSGGSSSSGGGSSTPAPTPDPVCTTSQSGVTTCN